MSRVSEQGQTPGPCACKVVVTIHDSGIGEYTEESIRYCPLHAAAPGLRDALDQLHGWLERHADAGGETPPDDLMDEARAAIARARGNA